MPELQWANKSPPCLTLSPCVLLLFWNANMCQRHLLHCIQEVGSSFLKWTFCTLLSAYEPSKNYFVLDPSILFWKRCSNAYLSIVCLDHPHSQSDLSLNIVSFPMIDLVFFFTSFCMQEWRKEGWGRMSAKSLPLLPWGFLSLTWLYLCHTAWNMFSFIFLWYILPYILCVRQLAVSRDICSQEGHFCVRSGDAIDKATAELDPLGLVRTELQSSAALPKDSGTVLACMF